MPTLDQRTAIVSLTALIVAAGATDEEVPLVYARLYGTEVPDEPTALLALVRDAIAAVRAKIKKPR